MITLPPIKKKGIPRQYFAALDHLNGGFSFFYKKNPVFDDYFTFIIKVWDNV